MTSMDNRLAYIFGKRVSRLRQQDLPDVAFALTGLARSLTSVKVGSATVSGAKVVTITSDWFAVAILLEDWLKIEPYIREGFFTPQIYPVTPPIRVGVSAPDQISGDPLYKRILNVLISEFPEAYPTSDL